MTTMTCSRPTHPGEHRVELDLDVGAGSGVTLRALVDRAAQWCEGWEDLADDPAAAEDVRLTRELLGGAPATAERGNAANRVLSEGYDYAAINGYADDPTCDPIERMMGTAPWPVLCYADGSGT